MFGYYYSCLMQMGQVNEVSAWNKLDWTPRQSQDMLMKQHQLHDCILSVHFFCCTINHIYRFQYNFTTVLTALKRRLCWSSLQKSDIIYWFSTDSVFLPANWALLCWSTSVIVDLVLLFETMHTWHGGILFSTMIHLWYSFDQNYDAILGFFCQKIRRRHHLSSRIWW